MTPAGQEDTMLNESELINTYEELPITDYFMWRKVLSDHEICREVLERLLRRPIGELQDVVPERSFKKTKDGKEIRIDIYTKAEDVIYDVEMQNLGKQTVKKHYLPKRSRYYQTLIDLASLDEGKPYSALPECNVIFVCTFDPFGENEPVYIFQNMHKGKKTIMLKDGTCKYFFNCAYQGNDIPKELDDFYRYIRNGIPTDDLTAKMEEGLKMARKNNVWMAEYLRANLFKEDCIEEGRAIERENTEKQRKRAEEQEKRAEEQEKRAEEQEKRADKAEKEALYYKELLEKNGIKVDETKKE